METEMPQDFGFTLLGPSSTIDLLWADCDLEALWVETHEEINQQWEYKLAA
jgi:hypothetical protein